MASIEELRALCFDESRQPKEKTECRATLINHLILEELMDVDEAEELTEDTLNRLDLWPKDEHQADPEVEEEVEKENELSTDDELTPSRP